LELSIHAANGRLWGFAEEEEEEEEEEESV